MRKAKGAIGGLIFWRWTRIEHEHWQERSFFFFLMRPPSAPTWLCHWLYHCGGDFRQHHHMKISDSFFFFSNFYTGRFFIFWPKWLVSPNTFGIDKYQPVYKVVRNEKVFVLVHQPIRNISARIRILSISFWNGEAPVYGSNFFLNDQRSKLSHVI